MPPRLRPTAEKPKIAMAAGPRKRSQEAVAGDSAGLDPGPVFDRLAAKYSAKSGKNQQK
jgi:hypothetical protein